MKRITQKGFTIVELMIATAIFAVVLLLITTGMMEVGRLFYKGTTYTRTQEVARTITEDISQAIQFSGEDVVLPSAAQPNRLCVGPRRYSFSRGTLITRASTSHSLVVDKVNTPCNDFVGAANMSDPAAATPERDMSFEARELMGFNMRLSDLSVTEGLSNTGTYNITVRIVYGDNDLVCSASVVGDCDSILTSGNLTNTDLRCKNFKSGTQFCGVSQLTTTVRKRLE